jgi:hypothetical protein
VLASAMLQGASWNRSNSCWDMSQFRRQSATLAASNGFVQPLMTASGSSPARRLLGSSWKDCRQTGFIALCPDRHVEYGISERTAPKLSLRRPARSILFQ